MLNVTSNRRLPSISRQILTRKNHLQVPPQHDARVQSSVRYRGLWFSWKEPGPGDQCAINTVGWMLNVTSNRRLPSISRQILTRKNHLQVPPQHDARVQSSARYRGLWFSWKEPGPGDQCAINTVGWMLNVTSNRRLPSVSRQIWTRKNRLQVPPQHNARVQSSVRYRGLWFSWKEPGPGDQCAINTVGWMLNVTSNRRLPSISRQILTRKNHLQVPPQHDARVQSSVRYRGLRFSWKEPGPGDQCAINTVGWMLNVTSNRRLPSISRQILTRKNHLQVPPQHDARVQSSVRYRGLWFSWKEPGPGDQCAINTVGWMLNVTSNRRLPSISRQILTRKNHLQVPPQHDARVQSSVRYRCLWFSWKEPGPGDQCAINTVGWMLNVTSNRRLPSISRQILTRKNHLQVPPQHDARVQSSVRYRGLWFSWKEPGPGDQCAINTVGWMLNVTSNRRLPSISRQILTRKNHLQVPPQHDARVQSSVRYRGLWFSWKEPGPGDQCAINTVGWLLNVTSNRRLPSISRQILTRKNHLQVPPQQMHGSNLAYGIGAYGSHGKNQVRGTNAPSTR